jgi:hypothetical protein
MATSKRDLKKEKYWSEVVKKHRQSGKSQAQFCKEEGLRDHQFYYWNSVLAKRQKAGRQAGLIESEITIPFVPLNVSGSLDFIDKPAAAEQIEISKIVFRISANTDKSILNCILQTLSEKA